MLPSPRAMHGQRRKSEHSNAPRCDCTKRFVIQQVTRFCFQVDEWKMKSLCESSISDLPRNNKPPSFNVK